MVRSGQTCWVSQASVSPTLSLRLLVCNGAQGLALYLMFRGLNEVTQGSTEATQGMWFTPSAPHASSDGACHCKAQTQVISQSQRLRSVFSAWFGPCAHTT